MEVSAYFLRERGLPFTGNLTPDSRHNISLREIIFSHQINLLFK